MGALGMQDVPQPACQLNLRQRQAAHLVVQQGAWQHAPGQSDGHQHLDGLQVVGAHGDIGCQPLGVEQPMHDQPGKGIATGKHRRMSCHVGQADLCLVRQRMFGCRDEIQRIAPYRYRLDRRRGLGCQGDDRQLHPPMQDLVVGRFRIEKADIQGDVGIVPGEAPEDRGQSVQADVVTGRQRQSAADGTIEIGQGTPGVIDHA